MDLKKLWAEWPPATETSTFPVEPSSGRTNWESPITALRRSIRMNSLLTAFFSIAGLLLWYLYFREPYLSQVLGLLNVAFVSAFVYTLYLYRQLPNQLPVDGPIRPTLQRYHHIISRWLRTNERIALFFYPLSVCTGFFIGLLNYQDISVALQSPGILWALGICLLVLVPLSHYLSRWMGQQAFGQYLEQLEQHLAILEAED